jgi:hypothetical protein
LAVGFLILALSVGIVSTAAMAKSEKAPTMASLTIKITVSNKQVEGKITVTYKSGGKMKTLGTCRKGSCTMKVANNTALTLTQKGLDKTGPYHFSTWKTKNSKDKTSTSKSSTLKYTISTKATIWANYQSIA